MPDIFSPAALGPVSLRNRIIKSATFEGRAPRGLVTDDLIGFHRRFAGRRGRDDHAGVLRGHGGR